MADPWAPRMSAEDITAFLSDHFPQALTFGAVIDAIGPDHLDLRLPCGDDHLRPGGTVSGPTMMTLADTAMYFLVLSQIGPVALAVTQSLDIHFLRRPAPGDLVARAEMLRLGRRVAVGRVTVTAGAGSEPVAHATVTYALPPR